MGLTSDSPSVGKIARSIILYFLTAAAGWLTTSVTNMNLWTTTLKPAIHIVPLTGLPGVCTYKMWSDGQTYEKVEVTSKTTCDSFQLCNSDPCIDGAVVLKTQPFFRDPQQRLVRMPEERFSGDLARRFTLMGCTVCPSEVYASGIGPKAISTSLGHQRQAFWYRIALAVLILIAAIVLGSFDSSVRSIWANWSSMRKLTAGEASAWKKDRAKLRQADLNDAASSFRSEVQNWLDNPSSAELVAIAQTLMAEAKGPYPSQFILFPESLERRRAQYGREQHEVSFVLWWLIRHISVTIERNK